MWEVLDEINKTALEAARAYSDFSVESFVKIHVKQLLHKLYFDLDAEEQFLNSALASKATPDSSSHLSSRRMMQHCFKLMHASDDPTGGVKLLGPLGERPLLVCFSRAHDFEKDVRDGVLSASMDFVCEWSSAGYNGRDELNRAYGKDYIAAIARLAWSEVAGSGHHPALARLPFWDTVRDAVRSAHKLWKKLEALERDDDSAGAYLAGRLRDDVERNATRGLREGETPLCAAIARGDRAVETVRWMLSHGARCARAAAAAVRAAIA